MNIKDNFKKILLSALMCGVFQVNASEAPFSTGLGATQGTPSNGCHNEQVIFWECEDVLSACYAWTDLNDLWALSHASRMSSKAVSRILKNSIDTKEGIFFEKNEKGLYYSGVAFEDQVCARILHDTRFFEKKNADGASMNSSILAILTKGISDDGRKQVLFHQMLNLVDIALVEYYMAYNIWNHFQGGELNEKLTVLAQSVPKTAQQRIIDYIAHSENKVFSAHQITKLTNVGWVPAKDYEAQYVKIKEQASPQESKKLIALVQEESEIIKDLAFKDLLPILTRQEIKEFAEGGCLAPQDNITTNLVKYIIEKDGCEKSIKGRAELEKLADEQGWVIAQYYFLTCFVLKETKYSNNLYSQEVMKAAKKGWSAAQKSVMKDEDVN